MLNEVASTEAITNGVNGETFDRIEIAGDIVRLDNFYVRDADLARHLDATPASERCGEMMKIIEVGLFCVLRASATQDAEYIKHEAQRVIDSVETRFGVLPTQVRDDLLAKIGTGDGQVLKPVADLIDHVHKVLKENLGSLSTLVGEKLDPEKESTHLGSVLKAIGDKLDPKQKGSIQSVLEESIKGVTVVDGALATTVKETVADVIKPLKEELDQLAKEIRGQEAAAEAIQQTTLKGAPYEERVYEQLKPWADAVGAEIVPIGADNKPGDVLITIPQDTVCGTELRLVIEARDRQAAKGHKALADDLDKKMAERDCNAAIYVTNNPAGLAKSVGDFCEGTGQRGPWVAATHEHLNTAVRLAIVRHRLRSAYNEAPDFDGALIEAQLDRIRNALKRITTIKRNVNNARSSVDNIATEGEAIRDEVREALAGIEDAFRSAA